MSRARLGADRLDGGAALAEHDLALALALDIDRLLDAHRAVLAVPSTVRSRPWTGTAVPGAGAEELLAGDLGRKLAQRRVGNLVFGIVPRSRRHVRGKPALARSATPSPVSAEIMKVSSNFTRALAACASASKAGLSTRSTLLSDQRLAAAAVSASRSRIGLGLLVDARAWHRPACRRCRRRAHRPRRSSPWRGRASASARRCRACRQE